MSRRYSALVRIAQVIDLDVLANPESIRAGRELYAVGALKLAPRGAPVRINHEGDEIGRVDRLSEWHDGSGTHVFASCVIDQPPDWLARGVSASMSWANIGAATEMPGGWTRFSGGVVTEVSLLVPYVRPREARARVVSLERIAATSDGEIIHNGEMIRRPAGGQILGVR